MRKSLWVFLLNFICISFVSASSLQDTDSDFDSFLKSFTSSTEFQYSRVKFPLTTPIYLLDGEGNEVEVAFTAEEWPLLGSNDFRVGTFYTEDGIVFGEYTTKSKDKVIFESGLEESELDLLITFERIDGKWYVTDCYNAWYGSARVEDFDGMVYEVQQINADFMERNP